MGLARLSLPLDLILRFYASVNSVTSPPPSLGYSTCA
jgi:hypothetical protein